VAEVERGDGVDLQLRQRLKALPFVSYDNKYPEDDRLGRVLSELGANNRRRVEPGRPLHQLGSVAASERQNFASGSP
jgi:hypothetical protein